MSSTTADHDQDRSMVKMMGIVMGSLVVITLLCMIAARFLSFGEEGPLDPMMRAALIDRIEPVAHVRTAAEAAIESAAAGSSNTAGAVAAPVATRTADELIQGSCAACHISGVANAPKIGDDAAWAERRELGLEALMASVINGKGAMPPRAGSTYTDDELKRAVQSLAGME